MFRLKVTLTHAILVGLLLGGAHMFLSSEVRPAVDENAELSLRRAALIAEQTKRFDHFALQEKGEMVAGDRDTYEYLTFGREKLLDKINNAGVDLLGRKVQQKLGGEEKKDEAKEASEKGGENLATADLRHLAVHFRLLVAKNRFEAISKDRPSDARNVGRSLLERDPVQPDLVAIVNGDGKAVAALGKDRYAWGASKQSPNLASKYESIQTILDNPGRSPALDVWKWQWSSGDDGTLYQVAVVPLRPSAGRSPAGAVIVGYPITDGAAENIQSLVGGVTAKKRKRAGYIGEQDLPDVAFIQGNSIQSSTFGPNLQKKLSSRLFENEEILAKDKPEQLIDFGLSGDPYNAFVRFLPEQFRSENPTGIVVMSNMAEARAPLSSALSKINIAAGAAIVLGVALLLFFFQRFIKPVSEIEETIAEILSGNKEAEFVLSSEGTIFESVVQGLNLVSAYLQDKPMPDEEAELEGWGDLVGPDDDSGGGGGGGGGGSPDVQGVQMPGMGGGGDDEES